jgi:type IV fimbrial biogenesis protein FimT
MLWGTFFNRMDNNTKPSIQPRTGRDFFAQGVTLIELIVTISIMAILLAMGAPSFQTAMVSNRLTSQTNMLLGALSYTRSEAIKRNRNVVLTPIVASHWEGGWTVFVDLNADNTFDADQEPELQRYDAVSRGYTVEYAAFPSNARVAYRPDGRTTSNGHFDICSPGSTCEDFRQIVIADTGRVHVETPKSLKDKNEGSLPAGEPHQP